MGRLALTKQFAMRVCCQVAVLPVVVVARRVGVRYAPPYAFPFSTRQPSMSAWASSSVASISLLSRLSLSFPLNDSL